MQVKDDRRDTSRRKIKQTDFDKSFQKWYWLLGILLFAAVTRILYFIYFYNNDPYFDFLLPDAQRYHEWATAIAHGELYEDGPFYQAPLYPYLLGFLYLVFGSSPIVIYLFQSLSGLVLIFLIYIVGNRTYGARCGLTAAGIAAFYGVFLFNETKLLPGSICALLTLIAIERIQISDASLRSLYWILAGLMIGFAAIVSPGILLLVPLIFFWIIQDDSRAWSDKIRRSAFLLIGVFLIITPVTLRNIWIGKDLVLISANGGITFYHGNNPESIGLYSTSEEFSHSIFEQRQESREKAEGEVGHAMLDSEVSRFWFQKGINFIKEEPFRYLQLLSRKAGLIIDNYEHPLEYNPQLDTNPIRYLVPFPFALILGFAFARFFVKPRVRRPEVPLFLLLLAQAVMLLAFYVSGRYRLTAMPILIVLAGAGAVALWDRIRSSPLHSLIPIIVFISIVLVSFLHTPLRFPQLYAMQDAMTLCDLGGTYFLNGQFEKAVEVYQKAIKLYPEYSYGHLLLAKALREQGDHAAAEQSLHQTLIIDPGLAEAHLDLGVLLYEDGRLNEAADSFAEAFRLDPLNSNAGNNLIGTSLRLKRYSQAIKAWQEMKERNLAVDKPLQSWMLKNADSFK